VGGDAGAHGSGSKNGCLADLSSCGASFWHQAGCGGKFLDE